MTNVLTYSFTHSITYVTDNILKSLKDVIVMAGLDPKRFVDDWGVHQRGVEAWLRSGHLEKVILEIYDPKSERLITRWDMDIRPSWDGGDGGFWTDTDQLRHAILKAGVAPSTAAYNLIVINKLGRPHVDGWGSASVRSTDGMVRQSLGTTVEHSGLGASAAYWRCK